MRSIRTIVFALITSALFSSCSQKHEEGLNKEILADINQWYARQDISDSELKNIQIKYDSITKLDAQNLHAKKLSRWFDQAIDNVERDSVLKKYSAVLDSIKNGDRNGRRSYSYVATKLVRTTGDSTKATFIYTPDNVRYIIY